ncbi:ribonuclease P/MRP protein subunit POP1 [Lachancea thermotolerans CBS 6340]|uniref:KLTH0B08162p n=1 Tax=Lachancea thermotolerans (strain ATCC 56472 / CBS 6340 / NRRL Y-8284) TaxID=559295 RepID=C5DD44_LACTC|nr:KLTH0B08162p [Lachancea thermotolerans CBS 6340]CAR21705.1 KLTH0B08162p [Lachancea thermotolerans CBS 6340]
MSGKKPRSQNQLYRRRKVQDARNIRTEALKSGAQASQELSESGGMMRVPEFMASREFEVKQLQVAMHKSKSASSTRVFQSLPRKLRRRTASHNVKRIPKRLRNRALREMQKSDQAVTRGTEKPSRQRRSGLTAKQLYKARMTVKLLRLAARSKSMKLALPAQVTGSQTKLRQRIRALQKTLRAEAKPGTAQLRNNQMGSYDCTGIGKLAPRPVGRIKYMKRQRVFTWLPTHVWNAKRSHMLKRWGYQMPWSPTQKCFKLTHRIGGNTAASDGALCCDSSYMGTMIVASADTEALRLLAHQLTNKRATLPKYRVSGHWFEGLIYDENAEAVGPGEILWISSNKLLLRLHPAIYSRVFEQISLANSEKKFVIQDCRFSIGSITLSGGKSLNALSQVLRSTTASKSYNQFKTVAYVTDTNVLPQRTVFAFEAIDPRHLSNPRALPKANINANDVLKLQAEYPREEIAEVLEKLCNPDKREMSYKNQQTLKQLAYRRRMLLESTARTNAIPHDSKEDPFIPIAIFKRPKQESWVVLLPWFWLLPLWYQLNRVSRVYHMGLRQLQQLSFEQRRLYFPDDYPFTQAGYDENSTFKRLSQEALWKRKPAGKRVNFDKISGIHTENPVRFPGEIGDPFSCDWRLLQVLRNGIDFLRTRDQGPIRMYDPKRTSQFDELNMRKLMYVNDIIDLYSDVQDKKLTPSALPISIFTKSVKGANSGCPQYGNSPRMQIVTTPLQVAAVSCVLQEQGHPKDFARVYAIPAQDMDYWLSIVNIKARSNGKRDHDTAQPTPGVQDLIGFVTSGTFHLGDGRGACTAFIAAQEACKSPNEYVLIRNVGTNVYRVAKWEQIAL